MLIIIIIKINDGGSAAAVARMIPPRGGGEELSASSVFSPDVTHSGLTSLCDALTLSQVEAMRGSLPPQRV